MIRVLRKMRVLMADVHIPKGEALPPRVQELHLFFVIVATIFGWIAITKTDLLLRYGAGWVACAAFAGVIATYNAWPFCWLDNAGDWRAIALGPLTLAACLLRGVVCLLLPSGSKIALRRRASTLYDMSGERIVSVSLVAGYLVLMYMEGQSVLTLPEAVVLTSHLIVVMLLIYDQWGAYAKRNKSELAS